MLLILIGGIFSTILMNLAVFISAQKYRTFESYASNVEKLNFVILYTVLFSLIAGYAFSREFTDKTSSTVYSYPINKIKIFIGKLITIYILISLVYFVEFISIYLGYYMLYPTCSEFTFLDNHIKFYLYSLVFQLSIIPIPMLIANFSRNIMMSVVYGVVGTVITAVLSESDLLFAKHFPLKVPFNFIKKLYEPNLIDLKYSIISGSVCFIISISICMYHYNKQDIV